MSEQIPNEWLELEARLKEEMARYGSLSVAYSGGVDSTYLADVAHETLGTRALMITADSPSMPRRELNDAVAIANERGWRLAVLQTREFDNDEYLRNDGRRCYICKHTLFSQFIAYAAQQGIATIAYGETADDLNDKTRIGVRAADELGAVAPLRALGISKDQVRALSRRRGLPTWDKPSFACLGSRFPKGTRLSPENMARVERAEELLRNLGFRQYRARHHGDICRIEVEAADIARLIEPAIRDTLVRELTAAGYRHITVDLAGYRTGSTAG